MDKIKMTKRELNLLTHYEVWKETTDNPFHKDYATQMWNAVLGGHYKRTFQELGVNGKRFYDPVKNVIYPSVREAAKAYKVGEDTMSINYLRYGLKKLK